MKNLKIINKSCVWFWELLTGNTNYLKFFQLWKTVTDDCNFQNIPQFIETVKNANPKSTVE